MTTNCSIDRLWYKWKSFWRWWQTSNPALGEATAQQIATNHQKLHSIVETVLLCGWQIVPLHGHCDSTMDVEHTPNAQHGNFGALVQFRVAAGDTLLRDYLAQSSRNATYTSESDIGHSWKHHCSQRCHLLHCNRRQSNRLFKWATKPCVEVRKITRSEKTCRLHWMQLTGRALADKILTFLSSHGLDPSKLRGQAYDGAGNINVSGRLNGTASLISNDYPLALYLHCTSHSLNLAVVKSLDETSVQNMIGVVNRVSIFFSLLASKRQRKIEEAIDQTQPVKKLKDLCHTWWVKRIDALERFSKLHSSLVSCFQTISAERSKRQRKIEEAIDQTQPVKKLKDLCHTWWVKRIDALERFSKLHSSLVSCFQTISAERSSCWTRDSLTSASTLLLAISTTDFVSALVITSSSLSYLMALTKSLQSYCWSRGWDWCPQIRSWRPKGQCRHISWQVVCWSWTNVYHILLAVMVLC